MQSLTQQRKREIHTRVTPGLLASWAIAISFNGAISQPSIAQQRTYECVRIQGVPITVAYTAGGRLPMIRWVSTDLPPPLTPQQRCQTVSQQLQAYRDNGNLKFITTGTVNGKPAVCVASIRGGTCAGLLFEVKPGTDPSAEKAIESTRT